MGYYASVEPASDDVVVGNPQLQLSDVENYDLRVEYFFGVSGDLVAASGFYKTIEDPIESIILRNPADFGDASSTAFYRTFFNNPSEATLWGVELEARKNLAFLREAGSAGLRRLGARDDLPGFELIDYVSLGGNFTWIEAEVDRTDAELARASRFFAAGSSETLNQSRRLFGQPEWIANADVSFDHPDWGTRATLAFYAISDVLDAAGAVNVSRNGQIDALTLDRYVDSFHTLDLIVRQSIWQGLAVKFTAKNLTDSRRQIVYDPSQTSDKIEERSFKVGRDFSLELSYTFYELPFLFED
jgi:outer membrane receptor protein involved in Fe transport